MEVNGGQSMKKIKEKFEAAELWFLRRMIKISWMKRMSNESVLNMAGTTRSLLVTIRKRHLNFIGHVARKNGLEKLAIEGRIKRRRARGRQRTPFMESLTSTTDAIIVDILRRTSDREDFRKIVANVRF